VERILRSLFQVGGQPEAEDAYANWLKLQEYPIDFQSEEDRRIHAYLKNFFNQMSAPPDYALVKEFFEKQDDIESVARLDEIRKAQFYIRTNYLAIVRSEQQQQQVKSFILACRDAQAIAEHGRNVDKPVNGKKVMRGVPDAIGYLYERMAGLYSVEAGEKLEGVVADDADEVIDEYEEGAKTNKFAGRLLIGLEPVDAVCKGHRPGEYWIHCAFSGELKTTLALNYLYNNCFLYGKNIFYVILEMKYRNLRNQVYVIHSSHGKFVTDWYERDRKAGKPPEQCYTGLDFGRVRDNELTDEEFERLKIVAQDFKANCKGKAYIWHPHEQVTSEDIRRKGEMFHAKYGCDGMVIDYLALVKPRFRTNDYVASVNNVVREGQMLCSNFARGRGVPLMALFQLNRQGKLRADKSDGHYDYAAIAYANEIEKAADVITYTYLNDQLRREAKFYMGNLKNRGGPVFERMVGKILWQSKRMRSIESGLLDMDNDRILAASKQINMGIGDIVI
jgi:replicative DNA helicase